MPDRKKVMRGLECCQSDSGCIPCALRDCPYRERSDTDCHTRLHRDALKLIKEQENGVKPKISRQEDGSIWCYCGKCGYMIERGYQNYCSVCGTKIKGRL